MFNLERRKICERIFIIAKEDKMNLVSAIGLLRRQMNSPAGEGVLCIYVEQRGDASSSNRPSGRRVDEEQGSLRYQWTPMKFLTKELEKMVSAILGMKMHQPRDRIPWLTHTAYPDVPLEMRLAMLRACLDVAGRSGALQGNSTADHTGNGGEVSHVDDAPITASVPSAGDSED